MKLFLDLLFFVSIGFGREVAEFDRLSPTVLEFVEILGVLDRLCIALEVLFDAVILRCIDQLMNHRHDFIQTIQVPFVDGVSKRNVVLQEHIVEVGLLLTEFVDVGLQQIGLEWIDLLEEKCKPPLGYFVVEFRLGDVPLFD